MGAVKRDRGEEFQLAAKGPRGTEPPRHFAQQQWPRGRGSATSGGDHVLLKALQGGSAPTAHAEDKNLGESQALR